MVGIASDGGQRIMGSERKDKETDGTDFNRECRVFRVLILKSD